MFGYSEQLIIRVAMCGLFYCEVTMKVTIENQDEVIWYRDEDKKEGMASRGYIKDGTQQKIISVLESALVQAKAELGLSQNIN